MQRFAEEIMLKKNGSKAIQKQPPQALDCLATPWCQSARIRRNVSRDRWAERLDELEQSSSFSPSKSGAPQCRHSRADMAVALPHARSCR